MLLRWSGAASARALEWRPKGVSANVAGALAHARRTPSRLSVIYYLP
jgi:hypothetical protein